MGETHHREREDVRGGFHPPYVRLPSSLAIAVLALIVLASPAAAQPTPEELYAKLQQTYPQNIQQDPQVELATFQVHPDFEVNLFAASPWVVNPISMTWDAQGRLWVINSPMYPHVLPGQDQTDFISVLEDTDEDGRADKCSIFYDKLYVPTGLELGDGGVYVANQPDLLFLKDEDGDLKADTRRVLLSGFGTEDSHHAISAFVWGPGGHLYFESGIFLHTQVETPHGLVRLDNGGVFEFSPRKLKLDLFNVGTATNPWGHAFDKWGQSFLTEGPQGGIWYLTPGTVSSHPEERVPDTAAPKSCGNRFIYSTHFSENYQGKMVLNAFKNKTVNLYDFSDDGAGYSTKEMQPLLIVSDAPEFRPVEVQLGPDGAIYIADFFQTLIGHMQYEFRDPRRDHLNGRIWRITQKGRKTLPNPKLHKQSIDQLVENLKSPEAFVREKSRRLLYEREPKAVAEALKGYLARLDQADPDYDRFRLEALWVYQTIDVVEPALLAELLQAKEPRARAAAVRVLRYWLPQFPNAIEHLARAVDDPYPRVRLEALCALSYIPEPRSMELAARVTDQPMDRYLNYSFKHTAIALKDRWLPALQAVKIDFGGDANRVQAALSAADAKDAVAILLKLLQGGQVDRARREGVLTAITRLGNESELAQIFSSDDVRKLLEAGATGGGGGGYDPQVHARLLEALVVAAHERGIRPKVDVGVLRKLIDDEHPAVRSGAMRLAGAWRIEPLRTDVTRFAVDDTVALPIRRAAIESLADLGGNDSLATLTALASADHPVEVRYLATAALAGADPKIAAGQIAELFSLPPQSVDPGLVLDALLARKGGADLVAGTLAKAKLHPDTAKLALRHMNATGQQHPALIALLSSTVGKGALTAELMQEDIKTLMAEVESAGDPARGEDVFRRTDLACLSCHAVAGAGAPIGPDLEGLGASSPLDYLLQAVLDPNKAIREGFAAVTVLTNEGKVYNGILRGQTPQELTILDATTRELRRIPADTIEETAPAQSVMPKGLVDNMTRAEFIDLVRFIRELGRPGPYATRNLPVIRTWRALESVPPQWASMAAADLTTAVASRDDLKWKNVYSRVSGDLSDSDMGGGDVALIRGRIDVGTPGKILLRINSAKGLTLWIDDQPAPVKEETVIDVSRGLHTLTFRVDKRQRAAAPTGAGGSVQQSALRVVIDEVADSPARARVVNGL